MQQIIGWILTQRISIARAILRDPEIIIFDEPTTHLDSISIEKLVDSFRKLFVYKTCIFISHRLPQVSCKREVMNNLYARKASTRKCIV